MLASSAADGEMAILDFGVSLLVIAMAEASEYSWGFKTDAPKHKNKIGHK